MPYRDYLQTPEWQERRKAALKRAGYRCQVCNRGRTLHVHHRTYERRGAELDRLERAKQWDLLDAIDAAIAALSRDPGAPSSRQRSFAGGGFGITIRTRDDDWLLGARRRRDRRPLHRP